MLLGLGRGPPGRGPPGRGPSPDPPGPGRPGTRGPPGRGPPGPGLAPWPVPGWPAKAAGAEPAGPGVPGWPGLAPRGADPMPVAVELNGLLPGRGPGRGGPGVPAGPRPGEPPGLGAPGPGRGAGGRGTPRSPVADPPAAGLAGAGAGLVAAAGASGWACGNGTGGLASSGDPPRWPESLSAAGPVADGLSGPADAGAGAAAAGAAGTAGAEGLRPLVRPWPSAATSDVATGALAAAAPAAPAAAAAAAPAAAGRDAERPSSVLSARACLGGGGAENASLSLRTTGASIVEDADRTNSPISWSLAITALLSTPNSFASSYTRTFATALPLLGPARLDPSNRSGQRVLRPASASAVHRRMLIGRSSQSACFPGPCCHGRTLYLVLAVRPGVTRRNRSRLPKILGEPAGPYRSRQPQRPRQSPATLRFLKASLAGVQVRTPARPSRWYIGDDFASGCDQAKQVGLGRTATASHTGPDRWRAPSLLRMPHDHLHQAYSASRRGDDPP
jgi:hypothetical protein